MWSLILNILKLARACVSMVLLAVAFILLLAAFFTMWFPPLSIVFFVAGMGLMLFSFWFGTDKEDWETYAAKDAARSVKP